MANLQIQDIEIDKFVANISSYTGITIEATITCDNTNKFKGTYNTIDVFKSANNFYILDNVINVKPNFFNNNNFVDGVYTIVVKLNKTDGWISITNCIYIDITFKCKVAAYLKNLVEENKLLPNSEKISTNIHLLHYSLVNGSNCSCSCADMCTVFNELKSILNKTNIIKSDCGC